MSYVLRHKPESIGLSLDSNGWADIEELIEKLEINLSELTWVVSRNSKKRFKINEERTKIRASQGHSISVELELTPKQPPSFLYHGTSISKIERILKLGLLKMKRNHVHLSDNKSSALEVGKRHGKAIVLIIDTTEMQADGVIFFQSDNGVWLTEEVLPKYLSIDD